MNWKYAARTVYCLYCHDPLPVFGFDFQLADRSCGTNSYHILHSEILISGKLDEFMQLQKQQNLRFYAFLVDIVICNMELKLRFIIHAKSRIRNDVYLGAIERSNRLSFAENFMFFFCINNRLPIRRELSYTIHSLCECFLYQLEV